MSHETARTPTLPIEVTVDGRDLRVRPLIPIHAAGGLERLGPTDVLRAGGIPVLAATRAGDLPSTTLDLATDAEASLVQCTGVDAGRRYPLTVGSHSVGRRLEADIRAVSVRASRDHCTIVVREGSLFVQDEGSRNGTWVRGERIRDAAPLEPGDVLDVGGELFRVHAPRSFEAALLDHLFREATRDPLTQAWGRRYVLGALEREIVSIRDKPLAILAVDLDRFKPVNDRHGHEAGDCVLVGFAARAGTAVGARGVLGRPGGDEFLVVLPDCTRDEAIAIGERIVGTVGQEPFELPTLVGGRVEHAQTVSIGVALTTDSSLSAAELRRHADGHLYAAKKAGGNRCAS